MSREGGEPPDLTRTVVGGIGLTTAGVVGSRVLTLAVYLVLARLASPELFGQFAEASIVVGTGSIFVESGMLAALIHRRDRIEDAANTALVATLLGGVALSLCALAAAPLIALVFANDGVGAPAAAMSGVLLVGASKVVPDALLQRRFSFLRRVVVDPIGVVAFGTVSTLGLAGGLGIWAFVAATYAHELAMAVASWIASGFRPAPRRASFTMWKQLASYGRHVVVSEFVNHVGLVVNTVLLGRFVSTGSLGQYRYASRLGALPHEVAVNAGSYVLLPAFSRISHDRERFERAFRRSLRWVTTVVVPASLLLVPLGVPVAVLVLGARWRPAGEALMVLCIASAGRAAGSVASEALKAAGRPDILPRLQLLNAALVSVLMLAFLPFGLVGIAVGFTLGSLAAAAYAVVRAVVVLDLPLRPFASAIWPPSPAGFVMLGMVFVLDRLVVHAESHGVAAGIGLLGFEALLGLVVYLAVLAVLAPNTAAELSRALRTRRENSEGPHAARVAAPLNTDAGAPLFTVVIPAHNTAATIGAAIASALAQSLSDLEVIVVDDGSTDNTVSVARQYESDPRLRVVSRERGGPGAARNTALALASGRYVSMLDSDDLWLPTHLEAAARALEQDPKPSLAYSDAWSLDDPPGRIRRESAGGEFGRLDAETFLTRLVEGNFLFNSSVTIRRDVLEAVGGCNEQLKAAVDFDLWLRIAAAGHDAVGVTDRDIVYRVRLGSIQNDPRNELQAYRYLIEVYRAVGHEWDVPSHVAHIARARQAALEREVEILSGHRAVVSMLLALRRRAGRTKRAVMPSLVWYSDPPPEVAALLASSAAGAESKE
jgi:O-antigen/teichoic acid export membrane protein/glycosyltransferase involved in cell wall biosynthesis